MSERCEVELTGCTPEPLMSYLKALGVLRVVSEQADPETTGCWRNDNFVLRSSVIHDSNGAQGLIDFFIGEYQPTPILAPWNGGCGFYKKWDPSKNTFKSRDVVQAVEAVEGSTNPAFRSYRDQILTTKRVLEKLAHPVDLKAQVNAIEEDGYRKGWSQNKTKKEIQKYLGGLLLFEVGGHPVKIEKTAKDDFVRLMRSAVLSNESLCWLDAAMVLITGQKKNRIEAPLLGSGGNIGNSDFSARFMQLLADVLPLQEGESVPNNSEALLRASLFGEKVSGLFDVAVDQFNPGMAGSANMSQGMSADPRLNPWDYILMIEGSLLIAGAVTYRCDSKHLGSAFPFSVGSSPVGFASGGDDQTRGELWLPMWDRLCTLQELAALFSEGRAEVGARRASTSVDFARAVAGLGIDRGISGFVRLQFQKRFGDNYLASVLGRMEVRHQEYVDLFQELDLWLEKFRVACSGNNVPKRFQISLRRIESAMFDYCRYGRRQDMQEILIALGQTERELAVTGGQRSGKEICRPAGGLSPKWIEATHDGSVEFEIALSVAGIYDREGKLGPVRCNLERVTLQGYRYRWGPKKKVPGDRELGGEVVWNRGELAQNLTAVLERRLIDSARDGCEKLPLDFKRGVRLGAVGEFLAAETDDRQIEELLWGLALVNHRAEYPKELPRARPEKPPPLPRAYALLKLLFLPRPLTCEYDEGSGRQRWRLAQEGETGIRIRPESRVLPLLRAGRVDEACRIAYQRLRASGLNPMPGAKRSGSARVSDWRADPSVDPTRLAGALLLPVASGGIDRLVGLVTRREEQQELEISVTEGVEGS